MSVEERLERLERQNKWMLRVGSLAAVGVLYYFLFWGGGELRDLQVRSLTMRDETGKVRARLWNLRGPELIFYDSKAKTRMSLSTGEDGGPSLRLMDDTGGTRARLVTITGAETSTLTLLDARGKVIWQAPKE